jgi:glycerol-3-phosphate dehydrogenase subunit C
MNDKTSPREGSLEAPTRHPIAWQTPEFGDPGALFEELERVFDICHGCRRCFSLCHAFPTLFDNVDESDSGELDSVPKKAYWDVVDNCYLCDMCYMTKCPYVPPHEWNVDFPHLMLRAKHQKYQQQGSSLRDEVLSNTRKVGSLAGIPVVVDVVNAVNRSATGRKAVEKVLGVHRNAPVPRYHADTARKRLKNHIEHEVEAADPVNGTQGKVVVFTTCYGDFNLPGIVEDLVAVYEHNGIGTTITAQESCCGMPKLELGDLESVAKFKQDNLARLMQWIDRGYDIVAPVPSCVLMFKQELPLLFPDDPDVATVAERIFDPFEYLMLRHRGGRLKTEFAASLGKVAYQVPCHLRVQNIGLKTRDLLALVPDTEIEAIERCSGHDGTYAVKKEYHDISVKIARPVARRVDEANADRFISDCPMAAEQVARLSSGAKAEHPLSLLREAYGL